MNSMKPKIYISGPQYLLPNAAEYKSEQIELCEKYGFEGIHPLDADVDFTVDGARIAKDLYVALENMMKECHVIVADCNQLRGALMDDGAAYELGYCNALGKPSYGYVEKLGSLSENIVRYFSLEKNETGEYVDGHGYVVGDDFGTTINLMMQNGMTESGGRLVVGEFEDCLKSIRDDLDAGRLHL
jgi:nucleoside 2-deoxyribosyltransferase